MSRCRATARVWRAKLVQWPRGLLRIARALKWLLGADHVVNDDAV